MIKERKINLIFLLLNFVLVILWVFFVKNETFSALDDWITRKLYSHFFVDRNVPGNKDVVLIKIDEKFFDDMWVTTWTFHRWYYANLVNKLNEYWAKNVVLDVFFGDLVLSTWWKYQKFFNTTVKYFNNELIKSLSWNVVLGVIPSENWIYKPSEKFLSKWVWLWYVESHLNKNQINDWAIPVKNNILTLWIAAYLNRLYVNWIIWKEITVKKISWWYFLFPWLKFSPDYLLIETTNPKVNFKIPLSKDHNWNDFLFTRLFFVYPKVSYSMADVLKNNIEYPESIFEWKTAFIWSTDQTLNDVKLSYLWIIPWVSFHINSFLNIKNQLWAYKAPVGLVFLLITLLFLLWYIFVILGKNQVKSVIAFVVLSFSLFISYIILFNIKGLIIPVWTILLLFFVKLLLDILHILLIVGIDREKFKRWFSVYVWEKVLKKKEELLWWRLTEKKEIALMFTDIASFTDISEKLTANEVVNMLNIYFKKANFILKETDIYIDKYIWDAIMAFWEDNINFDLILEKAILFQKNHSNISENIYTAIWKKINLQTRIWLHYGVAVVGEIWNDPKMNYTAIWDNVNLASRLEWINKYYWTNIILSEDFYFKLKRKVDFAIRLLDKITVKWKTKPIKIYNALILSKNQITDEIREYIKLFEIWLSYYFEWNFENAKKAFGELLLTDFWKNDKVLKVFIERVDYLLAHKPWKWDWIWRFKTK